MNKYLVVFNKPYKFEGEEYKEVDLSEIEDLNTRDLADSDKAFTNAGNMAMVNETTTAYSLIIAAKVSRKPIEFFEQLPAKEGMKVKGVVMGFLNE